MLPENSASFPLLSSTSARLRQHTFLSRLISPLLVGCASFLWIYALSAYVSPAYFDVGNDNFWFDADVPRYLCQIVDAGANDHWRNRVHPLFSFLIAPLPNLLHMLGIDMIQAMRIQLSLVAAIGMAFQYLTLRVLGLRMLAAMLLICVLATSASVLTWFTLVESYAYTFTAFSIALYILVTARERQWGIGHWGGVIGLSFAITMSNVVVAGLAAWQALGLRRVLRAGALALAAVFVLAIAQRLIFPLSGIFFLPSAFGGEASFMVGLSLERLRELFTLVVYGSFVFPNVSQLNGGTETMLSTQGARFDLDTSSFLCVLLLSFLFVLGIAQLIRRFGPSCKQAMSGKPAMADDLATTLAFPVLGGLAFLFALHSVYGKETFLYTGSFLPLLSILLALGLRSAWVRRLGLAVPLLAVLLMGNVTHNLPRFTAASALLHKAAAQPLPEQALKRKTCGFVKRKLLAQR